MNDMRKFMEAVKPLSEAISEDEMTDQYEAYEEAYVQLTEIMDQLEELGSAAQSILDEYWPEHSDHLNAYGALAFGTSSNPHDTTFEKALEEIRKELMQ